MRYAKQSAESLWSTVRTEHKNMPTDKDLIRLVEGSRSSNRRTFKPVFTQGKRQYLKERLH